MQPKSEMTIIKVETLHYSKKRPITKNEIPDGQAQSRGQDSDPHGRRRPLRFLFVRDEHDYRWIRVGKGAAIEGKR